MSRKPIQIICEDAHGIPSPPGDFQDEIRHHRINGGERIQCRKDTRPRLLGLCGL